MTDTDRVPTHAIVSGVAKRSASVVPGGESDPATVRQEIVHQAVHHEAVHHEVVLPEAVLPEAVRSEAARPEAVLPEAALPEALRREAVEGEAVRNGAVRRDVEEPVATRIAAWKTALVLLGAVGLGVGGGVAMMRGGEDPADGYDARVACTGFVRDHLASPLTADFLNLYHSGQSPTWTVAGAVDAENSVGKRIRMTFSCVVRIDGDTWRLESLSGLS